MPRDRFFSFGTRESSYRRANCPFVRSILRSKIYFAPEIRHCDRSIYTYMRTHVLTRMHTYYTYVCTLENCHTRTRTYPKRVPSRSSLSVSKESKFRSGGTARIDRARIKIEKRRDRSCENGAGFVASGSLSLKSRAARFTLANLLRVLVRIYEETVRKEETYGRASDWRSDAISIRVREMRSLRGRFTRT